MKKTVISLLLVVTLVLCVALTAAPVANATAVHPHDTDELIHCSCGADVSTTPVEGHDHETGTITWEAWSGADNVVDGGHYFLTTNITEGTPLNYSEAKNFTLCLNGYSITQNSRITVRGTLTICDCASTPGTITSTYGKNTVHGATATVYSGGTLNLFSGNLLNTNTVGAKRGGGVYIEASSTFNMYGGSVSGGRATGATRHGGNVYVAEGGSFNMQGGKLSGVADTSTAKCGANIYSQGTVTISGDAIIENGNATEAGGTGGNIYIEKGTFTMSGGTISGGTALIDGGNIYAAAVATVNFNGGKVIGGDIVVGEDTLDLGITKMGLEVKDDGSVGVGYVTEYTMTDGMKTKLTASDACKTKENIATSYGLKLWVEGGTPEYTGYADTEAKTVKAYLANIMNINDNEVDDANNAKVEVKGAAYAVIGKTVIESAPQSFTLQKLVETMDTKLTGTSLEILADLYKVYQTAMEGWTIPNIISKAA